MKKNNVVSKIKRKFKKGFTLIELLAVIIILGVLMIIAIPSVTEYINTSRKKSYVITANEYVKAVSNKVNNLDYEFMDTDTTYYVPISCVNLEKGGESPFGDWRDAYVIVVYDGHSYQYYWTSLDSSGYKVDITNINELDVSDLVPSSYAIEHRVGIEGRKWVAIVEEDTCQVGTVVEAESNYGNNYLANVVQVGDFVNYDAGVWDKTVAKPTSGFSFGGYTAGTSRNNSVTCSGGKNLYNGWRVSNVEGDVVTLIHAGTPECYYFPNGTGNGCRSLYLFTGTYSTTCEDKSIYNNLTPRDWSDYVNSKYATSAKSLRYTQTNREYMIRNNYKTLYSTYSEFLSANPTFNDDEDYRTKCNKYYSYTLDDLYNNGTYTNYWFGNGYSKYMLYEIKFYSCTGEGNSYFTEYTLSWSGSTAKGVRPEVTLKAKVKTSGQVEQVVGTDGTTTAMVWQLVE